jgi:hypothetical protein
MKSSILSCSKKLIALAAFLSVATFARVSQAGLQVPYAPDADTLHLWHFDDPTNGPTPADFVSATDAVVSASITLTNFGSGATSSGAAPGTPPYTNIFLRSQAANANLGGSLNILAGGGLGANAGKAYAWCGTTNNIGGYLADTSSFKNNSSGAFTFEALLYVQGPVFATTNGTEWEILCGDSQGENGGRSWQFRMQPGATPSLNLNFITATGGTSPNLSPLLPTSGPDALSVSNWYHVAVTYTGNTPTNGDTACVVSFYWTYFDAGRTNADLLASFTNAAWGTLGGGPIPAVGGSARRNNGVGNSGGFEGLIDEVRVSDIARSPSQMAFVSGGPQNPPSFVTQPPASTLVGYGKSLAISALLTGSLPQYSQWQATNTVSGGWTNVNGQTGSALQINSVAFTDQTLYRLIVTNAFGAATSSVASVTVGASISELFNTGVNSNSVADAGLAGTVDPHYTLQHSADALTLGPDTLVWQMSAYPVLPAGVFALIGGASQWIGPNWNNGGGTYTSAQGTYVYRTKFLIDSVDLSQPVTLSGTWWENTSGSDILLNGQSTGKSSQLTNSPGTAANFVITNGFVPGINTLDFVVPCVNPNGSYPESAVRIELSGLGRAALPAGLPVITTDPANQTVRDGNVGAGSIAQFSVVASGRPPLSYKWQADGAFVSGATNRTLTFVSPTAGAQGTNFSVIVSNDSGSVTSHVAVLTLTTNQSPIAPSYSYGIYTNSSLNVDLSDLLHNAVDPDNDPLIISTDPVTTNNVGLVQNGAIVTFTPDPSFVGADAFNYTVSDNQGGATTATIYITVSPLLAPGLSAALQAGGNNVLLSGAGGAPFGGFHVLGSTNLTIPIANWDVVAPGTFNAGGQFNVTNAIVPGTPVRFYRIQVP